MGGEENVNKMDPNTQNESYLSFLPPTFRPSNTLKGKSVNQHQRAVIFQSKDGETI